MCSDNHVSQAIALLNQARDLLERTTELDLRDAADEIGPILLLVEDWQRKQNEGRLT